MNKNLEAVKKGGIRTVGEGVDFLAGKYTLQVRNNDLVMRTKDGFVQVASLPESIQNEIVCKYSTPSKANTGKKVLSDAKKKEQMILRGMHNHALIGISNHYGKKVIVAPGKSKHNFIYNGMLCKVLIRAAHHHDNFSLSNNDLELIDTMYFVFNNGHAKKTVKIVNMQDVKKTELKKMYNYYLISNEQIAKYCSDTFEII